MVVAHLVVLPNIKATTPVALAKPAQQLLLKSNAFSSHQRSLEELGSILETV
jgi:hypothetical protein